ncbi:MAG: hypothetical protein K8R21_02450, partial [Leptospira sp.]|nr:hypothetical protein [Leptospira sp.]
MSKTTDKIKSNILFFGISLFFLTIAITYFTVKQLTRTKLDKKISSSKLITFLVNGTSEKDELSFSVFILLYPAQKRCGLYFINPVSSFSDGDSILEAGGSQESFLSKKLSAISGYNI